MQIQNWSFWAKIHSNHGNVFNMRDAKFQSFMTQALQDILLQVFSGNSDSHSVKVLSFFRFCKLTLEFYLSPNLLLLRFNLLSLYSYSYSCSGFILILTLFFLRFHTLSTR